MKIFLIVLLFCTQGYGQMLSKYVSYKEAVTTSRNIPNVPDFCQEARIKYVAEHYFDSLRMAAGVPLFISSAFRSFALNKAVGGATNSDHMILDDIVSFDIDQDGRGKVSNKSLIAIIQGLKFYKMIVEFPSKIGNPSWIHISWSTDPPKNNIKKIYKAVKVGTRTVYQIILP